MPNPTATKYAHVQIASFSITAGNTSDDATITMSLAIQDDDTEEMHWVNPDTVIIEPAVLTNEEVEPWFVITRPATPDGTITITMNMKGALGANLGCLAVVTGIYWQSIQGTDHAV